MDPAIVLLACVFAGMIVFVIHVNIWYYCELTPQERRELDEDDDWA